jgi:hypothetical protein
MTQHVQLDNIQHKNLRVRLDYGPAYGTNVGTALTVPTEFADVQREFPIFFRRDKNGDYYAVTLLGFAPDENLYLDGDKWDTRYIPGIISRGPFVIGFQEREEGGEVKTQPVVHIDMDDARVNETEGEPAFLEMGGQSPYLQGVSRVLAGLNEGLAMAKAMFAAFTEFNLISPIEMDVKLTGLEPLKLQGFYSIDREKLQGLDSASLFKLHKSGFLHGAYLVMASQGNLNKLIERKVKRMAVAAA